ncbi:hypothetical protein A1Q1_07062 [Trichosporon asahii var. asahii CBS 2479]|uniref:Ribonuclease P/MRP protein subunit POP5 n=1 Tax=Trichosporon asahii var. asahii (strain ATCC 90039 / CBS 2479 / JCM 2466 / KCTC 7840 / NBRC 103889/ NCYC 2677 / UAMH 7654) TaxID=1186058 RepID=J4UIV9_TRIAS|nr:hypothetical protein A1Q1_07062 [Trichosporon asahii var. asahii CBS 2479]EJT51650.1 hypothetical protein A1Q1_07062 [Trichosporon asahii var. asahii CBS 2479]
MVRFKNRYLLAEFLDAGSISPFPEPLAEPIELDSGFDANDDDDEALARIPELPFAHLSPPTLPDEGAGLYKAVRQVVQQVFGDEGWGLVYHSPITTLTIIRIARPHYRMIWAALTLITEIGGRRVLPRVVAVSGTIKKLQSAAIVHHRRVTAGAVAMLLQKGDEAEKARVQSKSEAERAALGQLED